MFRFRGNARAGLGLVTAAMVSAATFLGLTTPVGAPMTANFEGMVLANYRDVVGVETWCIGETMVGRLEAGYTKEYCNALFTARYSEYAARLYSCYDDDMKKYVTPAMHAAFTDVYYNTGVRCKSGMMRALKEGDPVAACSFMKNYKRAGGRDCSQDQGNPKGCYGVWLRRLKFTDLCLADAVQLPVGGLK